jgi:hypothetical protein
VAEEVHNCINLISLLSFNGGGLQIVRACKILFGNKLSWGIGGSQIGAYDSNLSYVTPHRLVVIY